MHDPAGLDDDDKSAEKVQATQSWVRATYSAVWLQ